MTSMAIQGRERSPRVWVLRQAEKLVRRPRASPRSRYAFTPPPRGRVDLKAPERVSNLGAGALAH